MKKLTASLLSLLLVIALAFAAPSATYAADSPKATTVTSLSASTDSITVKWKVVSKASYQIQYSINKSFNNAKKVNVKASKSTKKISGLKANKKYYIRIRTCKNKKYSKWSKTKNITTKAKASSKSKSSTSKKKTSTKTSHTGSVVYITPTGSKYHYSASCAGSNAIETTLEDARRYYDPCHKCAS